MIICVSAARVKIAVLEKRLDKIYLACKILANQIKF